MKFKQLNKEQFSIDYLELSISQMSEKYDISKSLVSVWARKIELPRKSSKWKDLNHKFTERQNSIILGSLLGDGTLGFDRADTNGNVHFAEGHCIAQHDWLKWKQLELLPIPSRFNISERDGMICKNGIIQRDFNKKLQNCDLVTIRHPYFSNLEKIWYKRNEMGVHEYKVVGSQHYRIKIVPTDLQLTPLMIAVWYMDDGSNRPSNKQCNLYTNGFTKNEVANLVRLLKNFGFHHCTMHEALPNQWFIQILRYSYLDFIDMVKKALPDLPPCMNYKVDTSKYIPSWKDDPDHIPKNKYDHGFESKILELSDSGMSQKNIGKKLNLPLKRVRLVIKRIKSPDKYPTNTTGIENCHFNRTTKKYTVKLQIQNKEYKLGSFKNKEDAIAVSKLANKMRKDGIIDSKEYTLMAKNYKNPDNFSGVVGVSFYKNINKWIARINLNKITITLGTFLLKEDAVKIRKQAEVLFENGIRDKEKYLELKNQII